MAMLEKNRAVMVLEEQLMGSRPTVWSQKGRLCPGQYTVVQLAHCT